MKNTANVLNNDVVGRLSRRIVLAGAVVMAAAAVVVLGDNGVPLPTQPAPVYSSADEPASYCPKYPSSQPETTALPATGAPASVSTDGRCHVKATCRSGGILVRLDAIWCCEPGKSCYVKTGSGWINLLRWLQLNAGICYLKVGCR